MAAFASTKSLPSDTDRTYGPSILSKRYRDVLNRVIRWVSRQDSFETMNQLKDLVANRTKAIDEQVMLNFAAASSKATRAPDRFDELPCSCFSSILAPCAQWTHNCRTHYLVLLLSGSSLSVCLLTAGSTLQYVGGGFSPTRWVIDIGITKRWCCRITSLPLYTPAFSAPPSSVACQRSTPEDGVSGDSATVSSTRSTSRALL